MQHHGFFRNYDFWPFYVINSVDNAKLPFYTLPPMQHHGFFRNYDLLWFADQQHKKAMFAKTQTKKNMIKCSEFKDGLCPSSFSAFLIQENP